MDLIQKSILSSYVDNFRAEFIQLRIYLEGFFFPLQPNETVYFLSMSNFALISILQLFLCLDILLSTKDSKQSKISSRGNNTLVFLEVFTWPMFRRN